MKFETVSISDGFDCSIAKDNSQLYCWGKNDNGQLGNGSEEETSIPTKVTNPAGVSSWKQVTTSGTEDYACGIAQDDKAYCWGKNLRGQLGNGNNTRSNIPVLVSGNHSWKQISTSDGRNMCGIDSANQAYCWGANEAGQLGNDTIIDSNIPVAVLNPAGVTAWAQISTGNWVSCALTLDKSEAYCWGGNLAGMLGTGDKVDSRKPNSPVKKPLDNFTSWNSIILAARHLCALGDNKQIYCWGEKNDENKGALGVGDYLARITPTAIIKPESVTDWKKVVSNNGGSCAISEDSQLYCWGRNNEGQLGSSATGNTSSVPVLVDTSDTPVKSWKQIATSRNNTCGIAQDDVVYCIGAGNNAAANAVDKTHEIDDKILTPSPVMSGINFD